MTAPVLERSRGKERVAEANIPGAKEWRESMLKEREEGENLLGFCIYETPGLAYFRGPLLFIRLHFGLVRFVVEHTF